MTPIKAISRSVCGRLHWGPIMFAGGCEPGRFVPTCGCCRKRLSPDEHKLYLSVKRRLADLQAHALRAAWRPPT